MTERPILFSDAMVRAILAGTKTQTRRVIAGARGAFWDHRSYTGTVERDGVLRFREGSEGTIAHGSPEVRCPYGAVGDRLWVREAWRTEERASDLVDGVRFRADDGFVSIRNTQWDADCWCETHQNGRHGTKWRPSIHMPRWASRLTLEVTSVRVEHVQSISEDDARAEGVSLPGCTYGLSRSDDARRRDLGCGKNSCPRHGRLDRYALAFRSLWDSINGERPGCSWADSPWVWVVSFRPVTP